MYAYETPIDYTKTPRLYAEQLASYLNDAQAIYLACRRQYGRDHPGLPKPSSITGMIEVRKAKRQRAPIEVCNDDELPWAYSPPAKVAPVVVIKPVAEVEEVPFVMSMFPRDLVRKIAHAFGIPHEEIIGARKFQHLIAARVVAAAILQERGLSLNQIGHHLGGRDHSTVKNLHKQFSNYTRRFPFAMAIYEAHRPAPVSAEV